ncbi:LysM peptidoglycan-binding domain-containing protein [Pedococcus sp. NPDC057267]|uniref:LysM peptidoglycan-binding domain-containing protein n=1 Tax=Pedococcus sp. NPDC057267 TaxID=3346077 RepID=UPI003624F05E
MSGQTARRGRIAVLAGGALAAGAALETALVGAAGEQWGAVLGPGPARPDEVVAAVLSTAAVILAAWLALTTLASLLGHLPGRVGRLLDTWSRSWSPPVVRRVAAVLVGVSVSGVLAPGSAAGTGPVPFPGFAVTTPATPAPVATASSGATLGLHGAGAPGFTVTTPLPAGPGRQAPAPGPAAPGPAAPGPAATSQQAPAPGWVPERPVVRPQASPDLVAGTPRRTSGAEVVVLRGDSLWSIVARHLGPGATDAEVAAQWPRWHAANRSVIGDDPDLLLPGQVLHPPHAEAVAR